MKKIASVLVVLMYLIPAFSTVNAEVVNKDVEIDRINITKCVLPVVNYEAFLDKEAQNVKYIDFLVEVDSVSEEYCELTINGTIETDIGTVTFVNFKLKIMGEDCVKIAMDIIRSFTEN